MAVTTPTVLQPIASAVMPLTLGAWRFQCSAFAGAGSLREVRWRVSTNVGMTALLYDSLLVAPDSVRVGATWIDVWPDLISAPVGTTLYVDVQHRSTTPETSSTSAVVTFSTASAGVLTRARWKLSL